MGLVDAMLGLSPSAWLFAVLPFSVIFYWCLWIGYTLTLHPLSNVPGPFWASVSRTWYMYRVYVGDMEQVQRRLHEKYGPTIRIAPNEVSTSDLSCIPKIYRNQGPLTKTDFYPPWGPGNKISNQPDTFTCLDERVHSNYRRIVNPVYTLSNVLKNEAYIEKCSSLFLQRLGEYADRGEAIDLGLWLQMYAFDVVGEVFFGEMFGFMKDSEDHGSYIASLDAVLPLIAVSAVSPSYIRPLLQLSGIAIPGVLKAVKALDGILQASFQASGKRKNDLDNGVVHRSDLLQQLFDIVREKGEKVNFSTKEVTLESYVALFAGSDTTAVAFRTTLYHLMKNPEKLAKAHAEIDAAVAAGEVSHVTKYSEATTKLPYVCACIKEGMRLHPSVALNMARHAPAQGIDLAGKFIPAGYRIGMNPAVASYDKAVFGQDAYDFRPERWLVSTEQWKAMDRSLLIFGAGTRTCIGKNISLVELHTLVPEILRHFDLTMAHDRPWTTLNRWFHKQIDVIVNVKRRAASTTGAAH